MTIAFDAVGPAGGGGQGGITKPQTWTHICGASATLLLVGISTPGDSAIETASVTYNGVAMTSVGKVGSNNSNDGYVQVFALVNPATGSNTVSVTTTKTVDASNPLLGGSISYTGTDATSVANAVPAAHVATAFGASTTPSVTVTSAAGNMVAAFMVDAQGFTATNQTLEYRKNLTTANAAGNVQGVDATGSASVTLTGTAPNDWWGIVGVEIVAGAGGAAPDASFQLPTFPVMGALQPGFMASVPPPLVGFMPWAEMPPLPAVSDTAAPANLARSQSESVTISDTVVAGVTLARSQTESVTVADTQARALAEARTQSESVTVADSTSRAIADARAQSESVTVSDTTARSSSRSRAQSETVTVSDANARALALARGQSDSVTVGDVTSGSTGGNAARSLTESVTVSDSTARGLVQTRGLSESVTASDALARGSTRSRSLSESVTVSDATARAVGRFRALSDALTISDNVARQVNRARTLTETITLGDLAAAGTIQARALLESILITDTTLGSAHGQALDLQLVGRLAPPGIHGTLDPPPLVGHLAAPTITGRIP